MAFGNISTLYLPTAANAGSSLWGTDVRKLLSSADAGSDATTKLNHGTGGAVTRTADPYTTTVADLDQTLYGWAVAPSDMNSVSGARRFMPAGNHVSTIRWGHTAATAKNVNVALYIYRVGNAAGGRVRTLLGTANSGTVNLPGTAGELTIVNTVALGQIIFEDDETIQYSWEAGAAGTAVTGDILTFFTGTQTAVVCRIDIPQLATTRDNSTDLVGDGVLSRGGLAVTESKDVVGAGVVTQNMALAESKNLTGDGVVSRVLAVAESKDLTGDGTVTRTVAVAESKTLNGDGVVGRVLAVGELKDLTGDGVVDSVKATVASKSFDLAGDGTITDVHPVSAFRVFDLTGVGELVDMTVTIPIDEIPSSSCPSDWTPNDGLKAIAGTVLFHEPPNEGDPVPGATVTLIRDSDGLVVATTTTDAAGHYSFPRDTNDPNTYHVEVRYLDQQGLSAGGCVPA